MNSNDYTARFCIHGRLMVYAINYKSSGPVRAMVGVMGGLLGCLSPAGCINGCRRMLTCDELASHPGGVETLLVASTWRDLDMVQWLWLT